MLPLTPESQSFIGPEGVEPSSGPYKEPALAVELRAKLTVGPEGVEPTPYRLKGGYAAITPRPFRFEPDVSVSMGSDAPCFLFLK